MEGSNNTLLLNMHVKHNVDKYAYKTYNIRIKHISHYMEVYMSELQEYLDKALQDCDITKEESGNNIYNDIAKEIVMLRMEKGITQKQLADLCGIQQSNISRLEKGIYNPSVQLLNKIAESLGKTIKISFI